MDPGSGAAVFTGQRVLFIPALIALTKAMLSFLVRPGTDGTVIGGVLEVSLREATVELDAVIVPAPMEVVEAVATAGVELAISGPPSVVSCSEPGLGRASLLAAHANVPSSPMINVEAVKRRFMEKCCISFVQKL
jgi:hypothetical protein